MATTGTFTAVGQSATHTVTEAGENVRIFVDGVDCVRVIIDPEGAGEEFIDADTSPEFFPYASTNTKVGDIFKIECVRLPQGDANIRYHID